MKSKDTPPLSNLISAQQIRSRITQLARSIRKDFPPHSDWAIIAILNGSYVFLADLGRALHKIGLTPPIDFLALSSYGARTHSTGRVKVERLFKLDVRHRDILLVDDILDTGHSLARAHRLIKEQGARSIRSCVLLDKPSRRKVPFLADFVGFTIPDRFVAGYGLDIDHRFRNLPHIVYQEPL